AGGGGGSAGRAPPPRRAAGEFRQYVEATLQQPAYAAGLGVAYVFRDDEARSRYIANRAFTRRLEYRKDLLEEFARDPVARQYIRLANRLGRCPLPEEFGGY